MSTATIDTHLAQADEADRFRAAALDALAATNSLQALAVTVTLAPALAADLVLLTRVVDAIAGAITDGGATAAGYQVVTA